MPDGRLWSEKMINTSARAKQEPEANRSQAERTVRTSRPIAIQAIFSSSFSAAEEIRVVGN